MEKERNRRSEKFPNYHSSLQPSNQIIINSIWLRNLVSLCTSILHSLPHSRPVFTYCLFLLGLLRDGTMHGPWFLNFRLLFSFHSLFFVFFNRRSISAPLPSFVFIRINKNQDNVLKSDGVRGGQKSGQQTYSISLYLMKCRLLSDSYFPLAIILTRENVLTRPCISL